MFMHASWSHIFGNMVFLWALGREIEDAMGPMRYLTFYFVGGTLAVLAQVIADPTSTVPCLGASGAIASVMSAFLVTQPRDRIKVVLLFGFVVRITLVPAVLLIGLWFRIQLVSLGAIAEAEAGGVAYLAHIGVMVVGSATARLFEDSHRFARRRDEY